MHKGSKHGLYHNIHAKRKRIKAGSGEKMRKPGSKGAPTLMNFKQSFFTLPKHKLNCCMKIIFYLKDDFDHR